MRHALLTFTAVALAATMPPAVARAAEPPASVYTDAGRFLEQIGRAVKRGGAFLIVDHAARAGTGSSAAQDLHRIDEQFAIADIEKHGFVLEKRWDGLRNADDERTVVVFDPKVRGRTDRFVHLYRWKS
jgi:predicted methyltransferase